MVVKVKSLYVLGPLLQYFSIKIGVLFISRREGGQKLVQQVFRLVGIISGRCVRQCFVLVAEKENAEWGYWLPGYCCH